MFQYLEIHEAPCDSESARSLIGDTLAVVLVHKQSKPIRLYLLTQKSDPLLCVDIDERERLCALQAGRAYAPVAKASPLICNHSGLPNWRFRYTHSVCAASVV